MAAYIEFLVTVQVYIVGFNYYFNKLLEYLVMLQVYIVRFHGCSTSNKTCVKYMNFKLSLITNYKPIKLNSTQG